MFDCSPANLSLSSRTDMIDETDPIERAVKEWQSGVNVEDNSTLIYASFERMLLSYFNSQDQDKSTRNRREELTQKTFINVFKGLERFRGECPFAVWVRSIARRVLLDDVRARERDRALISLDTAGNEDDPREPRITPIDPSPDPLASTLSNDLWKRAAQQLPPQEGRCLSLFYEYGYSKREIAIIMKIKEGTVSSTLNHALKKLRIYMKGEGGKE